MIRTLAFIHHKYPYGGGERVTSQIASFLSNNGFKVYVFVRQLERENVMTSDNESIEFLPLPDVENINAPINRDFVISSIKERSIDLFIDPSIDVSYLKDIKELGVCKVIYVLHSRPLWEVILKDLVGRANSKRSIIKFIEWWLLRYPKHKLFRTTEKRFSKRYKKLYDLVDFYGVLCNADANSVANIVGVELETSKIGVLTNPAYKELEPNRSKRKQLIYVGRIENINKRVDRLIDIWGSLYKEFSDWELIIVGDGPGLAHLEEMVNSRGLERVVFHGYKKRIVPFLQQASIMCMTSNFEGWPLALVEAQVYGVIPISYNCSDGVKEIIGESDKYGVLVKAYNQKEYVEKLRELMLDDDKRESMSQNAIEKSREYMIDSIGNQWIDMIKSLN